MLLPREPVGHPVVESTQHPPNSGIHHPHLRPVQHGQLNQRQVDLPQGPGIRTFPAQQPRQPRSLPSFFLQVAFHRWTVVVRRQENSS